MIKSLNNSHIDKVIAKYIKDYSNGNKPIEVSFKEILHELKVERGSHLIHTYPAKLLLHIPYFFLNNSFFSQKGDTVLDPFCGTGTVLLESILAGRNALGADANPLARIIAKVKTQYIDDAVLQNSLDEIIKKARRYKNANIPSVVNCDYWFSKPVQIQLAKILRAIKTMDNEDIKDFFLVCFSNCVKKVSYADPRISVPVKLNANRYKKGSLERKKIKLKLSELETINVFDRFASISKDNILRLSLLKEVNKNVFSRVIANDARKITSNLHSELPLQPNSVDLIITSPPYAGAQKYIRSSSLSIGWLELGAPQDLSAIDKKNIGRESFPKGKYTDIKTGIPSADEILKKVSKIKPERAAIVGTYLLELFEALNESIRVLKPNGYCIIIIGNNKVCNLEFNTQNYISEYLFSLGLLPVLKLIDDIKSYGLMTKRNKTADIISREWILVFKKVN